MGLATVEFNFAFLEKRFLLRTPIVRVCSDGTACRRQCCAGGDVGIPDAASKHIRLVGATDCGSASLELGVQGRHCPLPSCRKVVLDIVIHSKRPDHVELTGQGLVLLSVVPWLQTEQSSTSKQQVDRVFKWHLASGTHHAAVQSCAAKKTVTQK